MRFWDEAERQKVAGNLTVAGTLELTETLSLHLEGIWRERERGRERERM